MIEEPSPDMIKTIAEELQGTCGTLDHKLGEYGINIDSVPQRILESLDEEVMLCEACGWWCDPHEIDGDGNCNDCSEDEHD